VFDLNIFTKFSEMDFFEKESRRNRADNWCEAYLISQACHFKTEQ
jgi:hypothetical protein